jgi:hypothetical protein
MYQLGKESMKRNTKAEAAKAERDNQKAKTDPASLLLTQLQHASRSVLTLDFGFTESQIINFENLTRYNFKRNRPSVLFMKPSKALSLIATAYGAAAATVLSDSFKLDKEKIDSFLKLLVEQGTKDRVPRVSVTVEKEQAPV